MEGSVPPTAQTTTEFMREFGECVGDEGEEEGRKRKCERWAGSPRLEISVVVDSVPMSALFPLALVCAVAFVAAAGCFRGMPAEESQVSGFRSQVSGSREQVAGSRERESGGGLQVAGDGRKASDSGGKRECPPEKALFEEAARRGLPEGGLLLVADTSTGFATLVSRGRAIWRVPFSWASAGIGAQAGQGVNLL